MQSLDHRSLKIPERVDFARKFKTELWYRQKDSFSGLQILGLFLKDIPHEESGFVDTNLLVEHVIQELNLVLGHNNKLSFKEEIVYLLSVVGALEIRHENPHEEVEKSGYYLSNDDVFYRVLKELELR